MLPRPAKAELGVPQASNVSEGVPYAQAVVNRTLPSLPSPTLTVAPASGNVYAIPSTVKDVDYLKGLFPIMIGWSPIGWLVEDVKKNEIAQMSLF